MINIAPVSVSELTAYIKQALDNPFLQNVAVEGEVSNFKHHSSGHMYFTLKDERSKIKAVMFRSRNQRLTFIPQDGDILIAIGSVGVYETNGEYQLYVELLLPRGIGELHMAYERLKEKLAHEGLFDPQYKRPLPYLPRCVGVITSPTGAAVRDIIHVINRRFPGIDILIVPALVQGEGAPASLVKALSLAQQQENVDVIIIGRGGGSYEELSVFNDETLARAIFHSRVPVVSAVGHETDVTIADLVADVRAPTPSAAAELVVPVYADLVEHVTALTQRMYRVVQKQIDAHRRYVGQITSRTAMKRPDDRIRQLRLGVDELWSQLFTIGRHRLAIERAKLSLLSGKLETLSPLHTLSRGYAICQTVQGTVVRNAEQVDVGDRLSVRLYKGELLCTVEKGVGEDG